MINGYSLIDGQYKTNASTFFVTLKDFEERYSSMKRAKHENAKAVLLAACYAEHATSQQGRFIPIAPPAIPGHRHNGRFRVLDTGQGGGRPGRL